MHCSCAPSGFVRLIWQVTDHWSSATKGPSAQSNTHASSHQTLPFIGPRDCPLEHQAIMIPLCSDPGTGTRDILAPPRARSHPHIRNASHISSPATPISPGPRQFMGVEADEAGAPSRFKIRN
ncbi:hypothetical protein L227DRAFT_159360 [Lentinus tigrinus ALCF2SS1-6]|uniref:Uncharacterized protein n=1 Tax=Lentinus tigrinus ALCF2SS1-6 TaxID=1328759 RepID=A0A5C2S7U4_9APHY|nr:hypothetical protein L227DRAFT_159360 [Lentinus tigrinus ALCF2SS1-6]